MARPKESRRIGKSQLALAVRKDFNAATVTESELITSFLYTVHNQGKLIWSYPPSSSHSDQLHSQIKASACDSMLRRASISLQFLIYEHDLGLWGNVVALAEYHQQLIFIVRYLCFMVAWYRARLMGGLGDMNMVVCFDVPLELKKHDW